MIKQTENSRGQLLQKVGKSKERRPMCIIIWLDVDKFSGTLKYVKGKCRFFALNFFICKISKPFLKYFLSTELQSKFFI